MKVLHLLLIVVHMTRKINLSSKIEKNVFKKLTYIKIRKTNI